MIQVNKISRYVWYRKEAFIWMGALAFLLFQHPTDHHYTLCPLNNLGFDFCPGCGLGRSVSYFFRGELKTSFLTHPLGIPAVFLLIHRIIKVFWRERYGAKVV